MRTKSKKTAAKRIRDRFGVATAPIRIPITIKVMQTGNDGKYELVGPCSLRYQQSVESEATGDEPLCAAMTRALTTLTPDRIRWLKLEDTMALANKVSGGKQVVKLIVRIETASRTFHQIGTSLSQKASLQGTSTIPMKALHRQIHRFQTRWKLVKVRSAKPKPSYRR